ncbi:MAG TPA: four helix bundle protein [Thermoanaerobaculia bacterium]
MNYRDLKAWQRAMDLSVAIFETVRPFPYRETRDLADQMRSSATSVPSNIAEACGRFSFRDQRQFIYRSRGSLLELETQVELCRRLGFITTKAASGLHASTAELGRLLNGLIRYFSASFRPLRAIGVSAAIRGRKETLRTEN